MDFQQLVQLLNQSNPGLGDALAQQLPPDAQQALIGIYTDAEQQQPGSGLQAVMHVLMDAAQGGPTPGVPPGQSPTGPAPGDGVPPGQVPPGQAPPGALPPPGAPPDAGVPPEMLAGQPTQSSAPPPPPPPIDKGQPGQQIPYPKQQNTPKYKLPPLPKTPYAKKPPSVSRVLDDARLGRELWAARDSRVADDLCCWRGEAPRLKMDGTEINPLGGDFRYSRTTPFNWVERVAALCAWTNDRVELDVPPRADDDDHRDAAQKLENWLRTGREEDSACWHARSEMGDPQPPLELSEAKGMALLGGLGWCWRVDPDNEDYPFAYEYIPWNQLYPLAGSITRQFTMPLNQARAVYPEIDDYYPLDPDGSARTQYSENLEVRIVGWSDQAGYWHAITWAEEGMGWPEVGRAEGSDKDRWIKKPARIEYGFPYYNLRIWNSDASGPTINGGDATYREYVGFGVLTRVRQTFQVVDMMASAIMSGALRAYNPPTLQLHQLGTNLDNVPDLDLAPGARNFGFVGDDVKPLVFSLTGNPDGQAMVQMIVNEMTDIMPPAMQGSQVGYSGFQQMQATEAASATTVGPIIDALEKTYQAMLKQRALLALRYSKGNSKDLQYFSSYAYRGYRGGETGRYGVLKPRDIEAAGVTAEVRYKRTSAAEEAAMANMVVQLTNAHLMSVEAALKKLGVREPEREWLKILRDGAMLEPRVLQGLVGAAIMNSGDQLLIQEWVNAGMLQALSGGGGGSQPAQPGVPSAAGMPAPGVPQGVSQPGTTQPTAP